MIIHRWNLNWNKIELKEIGIKEIELELKTLELKEIELELQ